MNTKLKIISGAVLTGLLGILMQPSVFNGYQLPDMGFLAWIYLVPLLWVIRGIGSYHIFKLSLLSAIIYYAGCMYWMQIAMAAFGGLSPLIACLLLGLLVLVMALCFAFAVKIAVILSKGQRVPFYFILAAMLTLQDYFRHIFPMSGFPWAMPAYSQGNYLDLFQWVQFTGVHGLNLLIYLVNILIAESLFHLFRKDRDMMIRSMATLGVLVIMSFSIPFFLMPLTSIPETGAVTNVAIIQGNISQDLKWEAAQARANLAIHTQLTREASIQGAQLAVWPETAYPFAIENGEFMLSSDSMAVPALVGAVTDDDGGIYNSAYLLGTNAQPVSQYHKRHLVPFGEYIPLKKFLFFARKLTQAVGEFTPGMSDAPLIFESMKLGVLICIEDIFPELSRRSVLDGANVLVNLTNDAWYGDTSAQWQHLVYSQFRALENARYLIRATNTGVSAFISPRGEVLKKLDPFTKGFLNYPVRPIETKTFYSRHGDYIVWILLLFMIVLGIDLYITTQGVKNGNTRKN